MRCVNLQGTEFRHEFYSIRVFFHIFDCFFYLFQGK